MRHAQASPGWTSRARRYLRFLVFPLVMASACGGSVNSPSAPAAFNPNGTWIGKTSQAGSAAPTDLNAVGYFSMTVSNSQIIRVSFHASYADPCAGESSVAAAVNVVIPDNKTFAFLNPAGFSPFSVSGTFESSSRAAGSLTATHIGSFGCQSTVTVTWTATK